MTIVTVNGLPRSDRAMRCWSDNEPEHGRYTTYINYGCRCQPCTADNTRHMADYRARQRAKRADAPPSMSQRARTMTHNDSHPVHKEPT